MPLLVPLNPTDIEFTFEGQVYKVDEVIKNGEGKLILGLTMRKPEPEDILLDPIIN